MNSSGEYESNVAKGANLAGRHAATARSPIISLEMAEELERDERSSEEYGRVELTRARSQMVLLPCVRASGTFLKRFASTVLMRRE